ncbi:Uncharacterised protein [uncultured archaeon]|nr:Uncharacterised protein [uncultured archaeon]
MVYGGFVAQIPNSVFIVVHVVAMLIGGYFALKFKGRPLFALFGLYVLAELAYLLYHLYVFNMLFSHVLAEVFLLVGIILVGLKAK